jgi:hypothetical protein
MSYRPITDVWILARPKSKYFGAYPAGFLRRARDLIGCSQEDRVLHVCSGDIANYKCGPACNGNGHLHGFGRHDITMDLDSELNSDYCLDARDLGSYLKILEDHPQLRGVLADPPYAKHFAANYRVGPDVFPSANAIVKNALAILPVGGRVGILSMEWPRYPKTTARQIAIICVLVGNGNVGRLFAVYERMCEQHEAEHLLL